MSTLSLNRASKDLTKPSPESRTQNLNETKRIIDDLINTKLKLNSTDVGKSRVETVKYTPQGSANEIDLEVKVSKDPLAFVPVQTKREHKLEIVDSTTRAPVTRELNPLTKEDKASWEIESCVSNWKNPKSQMHDRKVVTKPILPNTKQFDLAAALDSAEQEELINHKVVDSRNDKLSELKSKLLKQKETKTNNNNNSKRNDTSKNNKRNVGYDSRLFKSSKKPHKVRKPVVFE